MDSEIVTIEDALKYAKRIALRCLRRDPMEAESIAGSAAFRAMRDFVPGGHRSIKSFIGRCVRVQVWDYLRRSANKPASYSAHQQTELFWDAVGITMPHESVDPPIPCKDWQLLCEKYIDNWPWDVMAKRHNTSVYQVRKDVQAAIARFEECVKSGELSN